MTMKHFRQLADLVATYQDRIPDPDLVDLAGDLADVCAQTNPRFDRGRFLTACGFTACPGCGHHRARPDHTCHTCQRQHRRGAA